MTILFFIKRSDENRPVHNNVFALLAVDNILFNTFALQRFGYGGRLRFHKRQHRKHKRCGPFNFGQMRLFTSFILISILGLIACSENYKRLHRPKPTIDSRIIDGAHIFTTEQKDSIFTLIKELDDSIGAQVAVVTIKTLNGQELKDFSIQIMDSLKLGRESYKDGLLIAVSVNEQMMRMHIAPGLEKIISDDLSKDINQNVIIPKFKLLKYGQGVYDGVDTVKKLIEKNKGLVGDFKEND